jgi:hypothetical protein
MATIPSNPAGQSRKRANRGSSAGGVKMLITAASLAAVVGGWTVFTLQQTESSDLNAAAADALDDYASEEVVMDLPPLPTLIPEPTGLQAGISGVNLADSGGVALAGGNRLTGVQPTAQPGLPKPVTPKKDNASDGSVKPSKPKAEKPKASGGSQSSR